MAAKLELTAPEYTNNIVSVSQTEYRQYGHLTVTCRSKKGDA
jgi:hypothetical protein